MGLFLGVWCILTNGVYLLRCFRCISFAVPAKRVQNNDEGKVTNFTESSFFWRYNTGLFNSVGRRAQVDVMVCLFFFKVLCSNLIYSNRSSAKPFLSSQSVTTTTVKLFHVHFPLSFFTQFIGMAPVGIHTEKFLISISHSISGLPHRTIRSCFFCLILTDWVIAR